MSRLRCVLGEAAQEIRFGLTSGIPLLVFAGIAGYMLIVMSSAGYVQEMAAADIPRNAPSIVYMMTAGCAFFLFFTWAWVFAQPVLRDRRAMLHEVVLAAPVSLRALLLGRYLGALGAASLLGAAQATGFLMAPLLELAGAVPPGSIAPAPWAALGWGWLLFSLPTAAGAGALYLALTLWTRSLAGAFVGAAALLLCWMVAIALMDASIDPVIATMLDPSGYAHVDRTVRFWTPAERSSALYPLDLPLAANRVVWGVLPLLALAAALARTTRERLVLEPGRRVAKRSGGKWFEPVRSGDELGRSFDWFAALRAETAFQLRHALGGRALWICAGLIALIGVASMFVHVIGHADGPLVPSMELALPIFQHVLFLVIAFITAAIAGHVMRQGDRSGFDEMLGAAPAPVWVLLAGRTVAVFAVTSVLALAPGLSAIVGATLAAPGAVDPATPLLFQTAVLLPALLEIAAIVMLFHAIIRPAGPAYAASILATFMLVVNHETALVTHPMVEIGIPVSLSLSRLIGWEVWADKLLLMGGYKLAGAVFIIGLCGLAMPDGRAFTAMALARRLRGPVGVLVLIAFAIAVALGLAMHRQIDLGGYRSRDMQIAQDATWEQRWLPRVAAYSVAGGTLALDIAPDDGLLRGVWRLEGVQFAGDELQAELPDGFRLERVEVNGRRVAAVIAEDHLAVPLGRCPQKGCSVTLRWHVSVRGWKPHGVPPWLGETGIWLSAERALPRLGFDTDRLLRAASDRRAAGLPVNVHLPPSTARQPAVGVAPAGRWTWRISVAGEPYRNGMSTGSLDPSFAWSRHMAHSEASGLPVDHGADKALVARQVATDAAAMRSCIKRRIGREVELRRIVQLPRGLGPLRLNSGMLLVPEDPHWDVAATGNGRLRRQAQIAAAMAAAAIGGAGKLRQGDGTQWLLSGLPGAIGLLCVGDANGLEALTRLMVRECERAALAINQSEVPVGPVHEARISGWVTPYSSLASLGWAARQTPATLHHLIARVDAGEAVGSILSKLPETDGASLLGPLLASDVSGAHPSKGQAWQWNRSAWQPAPPPSKLIALFEDEGRILAANAGSVPRSRDALLLDARPSLERAPADNMRRSRELSR